jgi:hypothetical protein
MALQKKNKSLLQITPSSNNLKAEWANIITILKQAVREKLGKKVVKKKEYRKMGGMMMQQKLPTTKEKPSRNIFLHAQYKIKQNTKKKGHRKKEVSTRHKDG